MADSSATNPDPASEINRVIHEPARLLIMTCLYVVESADYVFLMNQTRLTWGNLSVQVSRLEEAGYLAVEKGYQGRKPHSVVKLTPAGREAYERYRQQMQQLLGGGQSGAG
jgi:DNA-binding MarR family transcriptional regulator